MIPSGDCTSLVSTLKKRVVAAAIASAGLQFYVEGTFKPTGEGEDINHGITVVGYDPIKGFKARNSWGNGGPSGGYLYVDESSGVCDFAMYVKV